jgi:hypothetical protein
MRETTSTPFRIGALPMRRENFYCPAEAGLLYRLRHYSQSLMSYWDSTVIRTRQYQEHFHASGVRQPIAAWARSDRRPLVDSDIPLSPGRR